MSDKWSSGTNKAVEILLTKHQARTSLGAILGVAMAFIVNLFMPILSTFKYVDFNRVPFYGWIPVGILILHIPTIFSYVTTKPIANEEIDEILALIEKANFSKIEKRQQYRNLITKVSDKIKLNKEIEKELIIAKENIRDNLNKKHLDT